MKFQDQARVFIKSGNGGPGCLSFRREKFIEYGGPNGGDGGRGGDVIVVAVDGLNTLIDFRFQQHFKAQSGRPGEGSNRTGADGQHAILKVPVGTQVFDEEGDVLIADLTEVDQRIVLLHGGDGGFGNAHYKSSTNRAPRRADAGRLGSESAVVLRLKLIADAGLVGLPNAGKSTFLAAVSKATPKIADYPFTTLHPNLGVVISDDTSFVIADIPGLIEGAHEGIGLGTRFLGHVERCRVLLHLVDGTQDDVAEAYRTVRAELEAYGGGLIDKIEIVALNKCDSLNEELIAERSAELAEATGRPPLLLSGVAGQGIEDALRGLRRAIDQHKKAEAPQPTEVQPWQP